MHGVDRLVVECHVEAQLVAQPGHLLVAAGAADDAAALVAGDLSDHRAHGARRRGDEHGIAALAGADDVEPDPGRQPGHAEDAEVIGQRVSARLDRAQRAPVRHGVLLPAEHARDVVAHGIAVGAARDDLTDDAALQGLANLERRHVTLHVVHAAAHVGIDGQVEVAHEHLAVGGLGHGPLVELELGIGDGADGSLPEQDALVGISHSG